MIPKKSRHEGSRGRVGRDGDTAGMVHVDTGHIAMPSEGRHQSLHQPTALLNSVILELRIVRSACHAVSEAMDPHAHIHALRVSEQGWASRRCRLA